MSFQQVTLLGNLGNDPEMRYTPTGVPVTSFSLAVNRVWNNQDGQRQEKTIWFRVTAWRKLAEVVSQYATKGRQVLVLGEIEEPRIYTDRDGNTRSSLDVTAQTVRFVGARQDGGESSYGGEHQPESAPSSSGASSGSSSSSGGGGGHASDEDIPF